MIRARLLIILELLVAVVAGGLMAAEAAVHTTSLHVLDVGQGDAILLRSGTTDVLVDGGPDARVLEGLGQVRPAWDRSLEVLVLTHPQRDHVAGLLPVVERERVGLILLPEIPGPTTEVRTFLEAAIRRRVPVRFARPGQQITAGKLVLTVLGPDDRMRALGRANPNNGAIVLRADLGGAVSALLTADIERPTEHLLVQRWSQTRRSLGGGGGILDVDVLKVGHHGSKTSTTARLLRATTPSLALVSAGRANRFGHPHAAVLQRLSPIPLLRTDMHGTVSLVVDGQAVRLACRRGC